MVLSAYIDGEVPERFVADIEEALQSYPDVRAQYDEMVALRRRLHADSPLDVSDSARRSWKSLEARIGQVEPRRDVWHRRISVPLPAVAAAAAIVVALAAAILWSVLPAADEGTDGFAQANDVQVTIRVDPSHMEHVLQWLVDKNMLSEVSIQLPEQQFQIVGEPVFVKPAAYPEEVVQ
jgi:anti-sigma factor RsiW